jgi:hypothetical protein
VAKTKPNVAQVTVEVYTDAIKAHVEERIANQIEALFERTLSDTVAHRVTELVDNLTRKQIEKAVTDALEEGWQTTNSYGEPIGPRIGLKGRIADMLSKQVGDYNNRQTRGEQLTKEVIDAALRDQFGKELQAARERFKKQLDEVVAAKFTETIKSALGLR